MSGVEAIQKSNAMESPSSPSSAPFDIATKPTNPEETIFRGSSDFESGPTYRVKDPDYAHKPGSSKFARWVESDQGIILSSNCSSRARPVFYFGFLSQSLTTSFDMKSDLVIRPTQGHRIHHQDPASCPARWLGMSCTRDTVRAR